MEDSRGDDERREQEKEDADATRKDGPTRHESPVAEESGRLEGPSTSDKAARRSSDEAVSETEIPISRSVEESAKKLRSTTSVLSNDDTKLDGLTESSRTFQPPSVLADIFAALQAQSQAMFTIGNAASTPTAMGQTVESESGCHGNLWETISDSIHSPQKKNKKKSTQNTPLKKVSKVNSKSHAKKQAREPRQKKKPRQPTAEELASQQFQLPRLPVRFEDCRNPVERTRWLRENGQK